MVTDPVFGGPATKALRAVGVWRPATAVASAGMRGHGHGTANALPGEALA